MRVPFSFVTSCYLHPGLYRDQTALRPSPSNLSQLDRTGEPKVKDGREAGGIDVASVYSSTAVYCLSESGLSVTSAPGLSQPCTTGGRHSHTHSAAQSVSHHLCCR